MGDYKIEDIKKTKARCPKCRSTNLTIKEKSIAYQEWEQEGGVIDFNEGHKEHEGIIGTYGYCNNCDHKWKFRCLQITELFIEED